MTQISLPMKQTHRHRETDLWLPKGVGWGRMGWECGIADANHCK